MIRRFQNASFSGCKRSQGAFEYILLLGGVLLIVVVAVIIMRGSVLNQANRQIGGNVNMWSELTDSRCTTQNLLQNPGFEEGAAGTWAISSYGNELFQGWRFNFWGGSDATFSADGTTSYSGSRSLKLTSAGGADADARISGSDNAFPFTPGTYRLSGWTKSENLVSQGSNTAGGIVQDDSGDGERKITGRISGTTGWSYVSTTFSLTESAMGTVLLGYNWGQASGTIWFDDVCLIKLS